MSSTGAFLPGAGGETTTIAVTTKSSGDFVAGGAGDVLRLLNATSTLCFVDFGATASSAATFNMPVLGNSTEYVSVSNDAEVSAYAITGSGTTTLYVTRGWLANE
jgi:hypothetical protein